MTRLIPVCAVALALVATPSFAQLRPDLVASGLSNPVALVQDPSRPNIQFVVEQRGRVRVLQGGVLLPDDFIDLTGQVLFSGERGLLGLAFAPDYTTSGRVFVNFVNLSGNTVIARVRRSAANPLRADPASQFNLVWPDGNPFILQPFSNHKGGDLAFGPDGYLYIGMGDGGSSNDPDHRAQNPLTLLGKMLRVDASVPDSDPQGYDVPANNPFVGRSGVLPEIWAFGFRNPWRFSFDEPSRGGTGDLVIADVGQSGWEEIDYEPAGRGGRNYGWRNREGAHDYVTTLPAFSTPLTDPIFEYSHAIGRSVTGGYVYRGTALGASFNGRYFFGDFVNGRIWSLGLDLNPNSGEASVTDVLEHTAELGVAAASPSSFGVDADGELYLLNYGAGTVYRISSSSSPPPPFGKLAPANRATGLGSAVTLAWGALAGASYQVCVTTTGPACDTVWRPTAISTAIGLSGLASGTYHWQVRATVNGAPRDADGGTWWTFAVGGAPPPPPPPPAFGKVSPVNGSSGLGSTVTLQWSALTDAGYWVCWDTTNNNTCDGAWWPNGGGTARLLAGLAPGTYFWQVRAQRGSGTSDADGGTWWSFAVGGTPPPPPATFGKLTPANGAIGLASTANLTWGTAAGATGYQVCVDTVNNTNCDTTWQSVGLATTLGLSGLANGTFYWQVRATVNGTPTEADGGMWWTFAVGGAPPPPPPSAFGKVLPVNGSSGLGGTVTLQWSALSDAGYWVCWDTTNNNTCDGAWWPNGGGTARILAGLAPGTYFWQVRAQRGSGTSDADGGTWWSFTVGGTPPPPPPPPSAFGKVSPANGASGLGSTVTLQWSALTDAGYWVCWDTTNNNACDGAWWPNGGGTARLLTGLAPGTYFWQVRAQRGSGTSDADGGTWWSFAVR